MDDIFQKASVFSLQGRTSLAKTLLVQEICWRKIFVVFMQDGYLFLLFLSTFTPSHW